MTLRAERARQLADVELRFYNERDGATAMAPRLVVRVSHFLLSVTMGEFFAALRRANMADSVALLQTRTLILRLPFAPGFLEDEDVRTFFDLLTELGHRSLSAGALTADALERDRVAFDAVMSRATARILTMHALAARFECPRVLSWVHARFPEVLGDEAALHALDYILEPARRDAKRAVRQECKELYRLFLMWARCLRLQWPSPLQGALEALPELVDAHDDYDSFQPAISVSPAGDMVVLRGNLVKCGACCDREVHSASVPMRTEMHAFCLPGAFGYWSVMLEEARDASGARSLILRRMPAAYCSDHRNARPTGPPASDTAIDAREGYAMEFGCARVPDGAYNPRHLGFEADVQLCLVRAGKGASATLADMSIRTQCALDAERSSIQLPRQAAPSALWCSKIGMPSHYSNRQYYSTRCSRCGNEQRVPVVGYCVKIRLRPDTRGQHDVQPVLSTRETAVIA
jgi:hypothetical protein